jgi:alanine dehydrogenase
MVGRLGVLVLGKAKNAPVASTSQKLVFGGGSIGRGSAKIPAGATKKLKLTLNRRGKRLLRKRKKLRAKLTIVAKGPTGLTDTVTKTVKLVLKRPKR